MFRSSQIDLPLARHLRRSQHEKWKVLIRVENSQWPLAGQKNTNTYYYSTHDKCVPTLMVYTMKEKHGKNRLKSFNCHAHPIHDLENFSSLHKISTHRHHHFGQKRSSSKLQICVI